MKAGKLPRLGLMTAAALTLGGAGLVVAGAGAAGASTPEGVWHYHDGFGNNELLTLNTDGTAHFASGCTGIWSGTGRSIAIDINANCGGGTWIYSGTESATTHQFNSKLHPGNLTYCDAGSCTAGTWYAPFVSAG